MTKGLRPFIKKELIEIKRDRLSLISILFLPSLLLFIYGYAISLDINEIRISLYDMDRGDFSKTLIDTLTSSGYFKLIRFDNSEKEVEKDIRTSTAHLGIIIYPETQSRLLRGDDVRIQIIVDGSNAQSTQYALNYLMLALEKYNRSILINEVSKRTPINPQIKKPELIQRIFFNPMLKSPLYLIPGLIAFVIMITGAISTSISIVREKENKTVEQIHLCPINPLNLILGKLIPYFIISIISTTIMITLSMLLFELPFEGSFIYFSYSIIIFLLCALGFGMLISTIATTQQVAFTIAAFTTLLPTMVLSGFVFPINNMPEIIQIITYIVPARYFISIIRGILLKGSTSFDLLKETILLTLFSFFIIAVSTIRIKKKGIL